MISITDPGREAPLGRGFADILRQQFVDQDPEEAGTEEGLFSSEQAREMADFLSRHRGKNILVHCGAGISRSGAVAETVLATFHEYEDRGWARSPNERVKDLLMKALGAVRPAVEEDRD